MENTEKPYNMTADMVRPGASIEAEDGSTLVVSEVELKPLFEDYPESRQVATISTRVEISGALLEKTGKQPGDEIRFEEGTMGRCHAWGTTPTLHFSEPSQAGENMYFYGQE